MSTRSAPRTAVSTCPLFLCHYHTNDEALLNYQNASSEKVTENFNKIYFILFLEKVVKISF